MLYKRGKVWWFRIKWQGTLIRRSTGTRSKDTARRIEGKVLNELAEGIWFNREPGQSILFSEIWEKYMKEEAKYKANATFQRAGQTAKNFLPQIGNLTLSQITPAVLSAYKAKRLDDGVKLSTVFKELQFVRRVFSLCKREWQLVKQSPFEFFTMRSADERRVRFLSQDAFDAVLAHCPTWLRPLVILARYTGMRRGNILALTWSQIDLANRLINLEHTKNGLPLTIPLTDTAYNVLAAQRKAKVVRLKCPYVFHENGRPYRPHTVSVAFKRACIAAGIENFRFHDLRHDFASQLVQRGNDLYLVQHLLGHKDGRMTQRYAHLRVDDLRKAVAVLDRGAQKGAQWK